MDPLTVANTTFALELFSTLSQEDPTANLFFSPFSMSSALAMVYLGTRGGTEAQLAKTLHFDTVKEIHSRFQNLITDINNLDSTHILKVANRLCGEKTYKFFPEFLDSIQKIYGTELASMDFQHASEEARRVINEWVKGRTEGKIPEILTEGVVDSMTKLLLVNITYFKGRWKHKFPIEATHEARFMVNKEQYKLVMMMHQTNKFSVGYNKDLNFSMINLPYWGNKYNMIILLPKANEDVIRGLQEIEKQINLENLNDWMKPENMVVQNVSVYLPRFKLEENYTLNSHLSHLGLTHLFDPRQADLSGMSGAKDLFISKIVHKSFMEVNEEGTEVDVSKAGNVHLCILEPVLEFKINYPFLYIIYHISSKTILFMGKVVSP